jgi:hypothetical protein
VSPPPNLDDLSSSQLKELVVRLLDEVTELKQTVAQQREEIARLKGLKGRPEIKPSGMENAAAPAEPTPPGNKPRRGKVRPSVSVEERVLQRRLLPDRASKATRATWCRNSSCRSTRSATAASVG